MGFKFLNVGNDIDCGIREVNWKGCVLAMGDVKKEITTL
jgi:hypothetical protein